MNEKKATVNWEGQGKKGVGRISTETDAPKNYRYGFASRFENDRRGTNPEELPGAAMRRVSRWLFHSPATRPGSRPRRSTPRRACAWSYMGMGS